MTQTTWMLGQIEVDVTGFFTTHHYFQTAEGTIAELTFPAFAQDAVCRTAEGRELVMQKPRWFGTIHELLDGNVVRATANRAGFFRRDIVIQFDGEQYRLEPEGAFKWGWFLVDASGRQLVEFQPRGVFKQGAYISIASVVDADLVAFAYYLVHVRKQEEAAAASTTAAS
jgi:hypothetical protein